jgi:hypothetical protein
MFMKTEFKLNQLLPRKIDVLKSVIYFCLRIFKILNKLLLNHISTVSAVYNIGAFRDGCLKFGFHFVTRI